jgi:hypothetical protein
MDCLGLHIALDTLGTTLPSNTTLLVATKWRLWRSVESRVDAYSTSLDLASDTECSGDV